MMMPWASLYHLSLYILTLEPPPLSISLYLLTLPPHSRTSSTKFPRAVIMNDMMLPELRGIHARPHPANHLERAERERVGREGRERPSWASHCCVMLHMMRVAMAK